MTYSDITKLRKWYKDHGFHAAASSGLEDILKEWAPDVLVMFLEGNLDLNIEPVFKDA